MISKRRRIWLLAHLLAVPLLAGSSAAAQNQGDDQRPRGQVGPGGRRGPMSPGDRLKQITKNFNLTIDEQAKIKPILVAERKKMQDLMNDSTGERKSMRTKMQEIQQDTNKQVRDVLDDKQKVQFDKQLQEREEGMKDRRGATGSPSGESQPPKN
jgi:Spy/CpxP family protein refolding chaperone